MPACCNSVDFNLYHNSTITTTSTSPVTVWRMTSLHGLGGSSSRTLMTQTFYSGGLCARYGNNYQDIISSWL